MGALKVWNGTSWELASGGGAPVGSMMLYPGETAPVGWLIAEGATFSGATYPELEARLGGTTLPNRPPEWREAPIVSTGVVTAFSGYTVNQQEFESIPGNMVAVEIRVERTSAGVALANPDHPNQDVANIAAPWRPASGVFPGGSPLRHVSLGTGGDITVTSGMNDVSYANSNINQNQIVVVQGFYRRVPPTAAPRYRWIIRAA